MGIPEAEAPLTIGGFLIGKDVSGEFELFGGYLVGGEISPVRRAAVSLAKS